MGKYMRKAKVSGEVAVVEVAHQSTLGVRTRARALAAAQDSSASYLELRSRRLEKPAPSTVAGKSGKDVAGPENPSPRSCAAKGRAGVRTNSFSEDSVPSVEVSFGQNFLEPESRERYTRETTPCSLIRDPESIRTPGSTTRRSAAVRRMSNTVHLNIPTAHEMDSFFSGAEQLQQQLFMEKYNFDPVNDHPLPGRYEWMQFNF